jgi:hypothetical protein
MINTPFRDTAKKIATKKTYQAMSVEGGEARSHGWWKNLVDHGAWQGPAGTRVGPPTPEALDGIAKLFGTTPEQVAIMIAADWYGVHPNGDMSARVLNLSPIIDELTGADAEMIESLARRLADCPAS